MKNFARIVLINDEVYLEVTSFKGASYFLIIPIATETTKELKGKALTERFLIDLKYKEEK
jgi:hypothetical protein